MVFFIIVIFRVSPVLLFTTGARENANRDGGVGGPER